MRNVAEGDKQTSWRRQEEGMIQFKMCFGNEAVVGGLRGGGHEGMLVPQTSSPLCPTSAYSLNSLNMELKAMRS